jgi:hypothetical protein
VCVLICGVATYVVLLCVVLLRDFAMCGVAMLCRYVVMLCAICEKLQGGVDL